MASKIRKCPNTVGISRIFRILKTHFYVAHGAKVVYLVRLRLLNDPDEARTIRQITIMQFEPDIFLVWILI